MNDLVMQNQHVYRRLVHALAYPARKVALNVTEAAWEGKLLPGTMAILFALLDGEVTYHIAGEDDQANQELQFRTLAKAGDVHQADYIVVPYNQHDQIPILLKHCKKGTLINPHLSATFIIECRDIQEGGHLTWRGPGIQREERLIFRDSDAWLAAREDAVSEFPLGVDIVLAGEDGSIVGLPRTTEVKGMK